MRYINASYLKEGMKLAKPIYGVNFRVMLGEGLVLSIAHIRRIIEMGYVGVYVADEDFGDINVYDVIPHELRLEIIKSSKEILLQAETGMMEDGIKIKKPALDDIILPLLRAVTASPGRIVDIIDMKPFDDYVYYHAVNVVVLSILLGVELGFSDTRLYELGLSSLLHDIGNIFIPKDILNKPGKLTAEEYKIIKQHSQMGFDFLRSHFDISDECCEGALQHHENYNGTGYPYQLREDEISVYGRIIAVTDVYDALTSRRPYRLPMYPAAAMEFIGMNSGTMFDSEIVGAFKNIVALYPSGVCVELTSGAQCIVAGNRPGYGARPRLRMPGNASEPPAYVDLSDDAVFKDVSISHIVAL